MRSPCGGFKTRVMHFRVKNTPLKDGNGKRKFKRMLVFLFVEKGKLFIKKSSFCFLHCRAHGLFRNSGKVAKFLLNFQVHFALYGQENYAFEREFMYS